MIYVISDTHIPERASQIPKDFVEKVKREDLILHAGDFTDIKVFEELKNLATLYAVRGNMDSPEIKRLLPTKRVFEFSGFKIGLIHGSGSPYNLSEKAHKEFSENLDLIIFGHSHSPYNLKHGNTLLFNPGSLSGNLSSWKKSYGIIQIDTGKIWGEVIYFK
jgi:putative phosphoesterase